MNRGSFLLFSSFKLGHNPTDPTGPHIQVRPLFQRNSRFTLSPLSFQRECHLHILHFFNLLFLRRTCELAILPKLITTVYVTRTLQFYKAIHCKQQYLPKKQSISVHQLFTTTCNFLLINTTRIMLYSYGLKVPLVTDT